MTKRKTKQASKSDPASTGQRTREEVTVFNSWEWPNDAVEECGDCTPSWEPDAYTVFMIKRMVSKMYENNQINLLITYIRIPAVVFYH